MYLTETLRSLPMKRILMRGPIIGTLALGLLLLLILPTGGGNERGHLLAHSLATPVAKLALTTLVADPAGKPPLTNGLVVPAATVVPSINKPAGAPSHGALLLAPQITFWYGDQQSFGQWGNPQPWINVLGNVTSGAGINTITYTLNGGTPQPLTLGPDTRRLAETGDFIIELAVTDLHAGANQVMVTATDQQHLRTTATMTVHYTKGTVWPLPYTADWGAAATIHAVAPVSDGQWSKQGATIRPLVLAYDRMIGIGDLSWQSYEVVVPVTIHGIDEAGYAYPSSGPGVGILLRWQGHYQETTEQPRTGWRNLGALGWFRWGLDGLGNPLAHGQMLGYDGVQITTNYQLIPAFELPYLMRMQVEAVANTGDWYRFKVWPAAQAEPTAWQMMGQGFVGEPERGSLLLVAHEADASFGTVEICPLQTGEANHFRPTVTVVGEGEVTFTPDRDSYRCGEVITLQATPASGWRLGGWSGAADGDQNSYPLALRGAQPVTATFVLDRPPLTYTLSLPIIGNGVVTHSPAQTSYLTGTTVVLTATAAVGWQFAGWELAPGDLITATATSIVLTSNRVVTATFVPRFYQVAVTGIGNGRVSRSPDLASYAHGTALTLTAQPATGWHFDGWQGQVISTTNPLTLTLVQNYAIAAHFALTEVNFDLIIEGDGTVAASVPPGVYPYSTSITLTAIPATGSSFLGWGGAISGQAPTVTLVLAGDQAVTARFGPLGHPLTLQSSGEGEILVEPAPPYRHNQRIQLRAVPRNGWHFHAWAGALAGHPNPTELVMDADKSVTAIFAADPIDNPDYQSYLPFVIH